MHQKQALEAYVSFLDICANVLFGVIGAIGIILFGQINSQNVSLFNDLV
jgi:hypothetical protein